MDASDAPCAGRDGFQAVQCNGAEAGGPQHALDGQRAVVLGVAHSLGNYPLV